MSKNKATINRKILMSGADYFSAVGNNPYSHTNIQPITPQAIHEHTVLRDTFKDIGIEIVQIQPPKACVDGVYTANWGLCRNGVAVLSSLPPTRKEEMPYAKKILADLGFRTVDAPYRFSGQGDALPCGNLLFIGSKYRTDPEMHKFLADNLGYEVIGLQTIPLLDNQRRPVTNAATGWPDSEFYDLDLALSVISPGLIGWCPEAFTEESRQKIEAVNLEKIEVSYEEAARGFACNLVSTGDTIVMSGRAPRFRAALEERGFKVITPEVYELAKGGGFIRCTTLTLDNS